MPAERLSRTWGPYRKTVLTFGPATYKLKEVTDLRPSRLAIHNTGKNPKDARGSLLRLRALLSFLAQRFSGPLGRQFRAMG